jgi:hypothetical protein
MKLYNIPKDWKKILEEDGWACDSWVWDVDVYINEFGEKILIKCGNLVGICFDNDIELPIEFEVYFQNDL